MYLHNLLPTYAAILYVGDVFIYLTLIYFSDTMIINWVDIFLPKGH